MIDVGRICVYCGKICSNHAGSLNYHVNRCIKNPNCMESYRQKKRLNVKNVVSNLV